MQKTFNEKELFSLRLKAALEAAALEKFKVSDIEREFNLRYVSGTVTPQAIYKWLNGQSIPSLDKIQVLAEWLKRIKNTSQKDRTFISLTRHVDIFT